MDDLRDLARKAAPDLHDFIRRHWPEPDRARHAAERLADAIKRRHAPPPGDRNARTAVGGVAAVLLHHDVSGWLSRELSHCYNEARVLVPLDGAEVDRLVNAAASAERRRRRAA